ncbi:hypothetical protein M5689_016754 [Euphorbia peplus]|nr:hypothetical protein M5689_016754 [Euphorbia peplus]
MASTFSYIIVLILLLGSSLFLRLEAREGPSPRGGGHQYTLGVGGIKHSGPSPGQGNHYTNGAFSKNLGGIKNSGPSPGQGNYYTNGGAFPKNVGGIKHSSPSHDVYTGEIKHSGPSPGGRGN